MLHEMSVFHFFLLALACYRLTVLVARDAGPLDAFKRARARVKWLGCAYCVSVWAGALLQLIYYWTAAKDSLLMAVCSALALSSVAIILDRCFSADYST